MKEEYVGTDVEHGGRRPLFPGRYVSWSAIVAGLVVALVCQILLTMLGISIGAATINPTHENNPAEGLGVGAGVWWFVTGLVSLFVGAFVAGRVSGVARRKTGALHGFLMWCSATALTFMVAGTVMGGMFGTGFSAIGGAMSDPQNRRQMMHEIKEKGSEMGLGEQRHYEDDDVNRAGSDIRTSPATPYDGGGTSGEDQFNTARRDETRMGASATDTAMTGTTNTRGGNVGGDANLLDDDTNRQGATPQDEGDRPPVVETPQEARTRQVAEEAAGATSKAALLGMLALLIGAGVCTWAGSMGIPHGMPPREREARVSGAAIPGEPVKG